MPIQYDPAAGQDQTNPNKQKQPPNVGGTDTSTTTTTDPYDIPDSSTYQSETNAANLAYQNAQSQLLSNRNSLYHQYGLTKTGAVDVNNPYGDYQMLLGGEGAALDNADNDALGRGLGTGGLAMQGEAALIPGQRAEQLGFQRNVDQAGSDYSQGLEQAAASRTQSVNQAYQDALQNAIASGMWDTTPTTPTPPPGGKKTGAKGSPSAPFKYNPRITANKTGGSARKRGGIYSIH